MTTSTIFVSTSCSLPREYLIPVNGAAIGLDKENTPQPRSTERGSSARANIGRATLHSDTLSGSAVTGSGVAVLNIVIFAAASKPWMFVLWAFALQLSGAECN